CSRLTRAKREGWKRLIHVNLTGIGDIDVARAERVRGVRQYFADCTQSTVPKSSPVAVAREPIFLPRQFSVGEVSVEIFRDRVCFEETATVIRHLFERLRGEIIGGVLRIKRGPVLISGGPERRVNICGHEPVECGGVNMSIHSNHLYAIR